METRKRHILSQSTEYLTNSELTSIILSASAAILLLEAAKPSRTRKDYLTSTGYIGLLLLGFIYISLVKKYFIDVQNENMLNQLKSDFHVKRDRVYERYVDMWNYRNYLRGYTCRELEGDDLNCKAIFSYKRCDEIQYSFCTEMRYLLANLNQFEPDSSLLVTLLPGILLALYAFSQLIKTERDRYRLDFHNVHLTDAQKQQIKSAGANLKLNISDHANINDVISAFDERINQLKGLKPRSIGQQCFGLFNHQHHYEIPFEMESNK